MVLIAPQAPFSTDSRSGQSRLCAVATPQAHTSHEAVHLRRFMLLHLGLVPERLFHRGWLGGRQLAGWFLLGIVHGTLPEALLMHWSLDLKFPAGQLQLSALWHVPGSFDTALCNYFAVLQHAPRILFQQTAIHL